MNTVSPIHQLTYFENILPTLEEPLFTANLQHGRPETYNFGFIDPAAFKGPIAWTAVTKPQVYYAYWQLDVTGFQVGPEPYHQRITSGIADAGTSLLYLPPVVVIEYYSRVVGAFFDPSNAAWPLDDGLCYGGIQVNTGLPFSIFGDILLKAQFIVFDHFGPRLGFANKL